MRPIALITLVALLASCSSAPLPAAERAEQFTTAYLGGNVVDSGEWFSSSALESDLFKVYGGPTQLAAYGKALVSKHGKLVKIDIVRSEATGDAELEIGTRATFADGSTVEALETWVLENDRWVVKPPSRSVDDI